ncbi:MAG: hypothetical protein AAF125_00940, partial [Chloroflexota bacterium]
MTVTLWAVQVPLFAGYLGVAIVVGGGITILNSRASFPVGEAANWLLAGLIAAVILARAEYVALNAEVFAGDITRLW